MKSSTLDMKGSPPPLPSITILRRRRRPLPIMLITASAGAIGLLYVLLSIAPCMVGATCYRGYQSSFSFDAGDDLVSHRAWMKGVPDGVRLTSLSIPGTHDTMTYDIGTETLQCQNWNLTSQMQAGLRYFDIRARLRDDELQIYHADGYTGFSYEDVLLAMFDFLDENPSEAIIMRVKEEGRPIGKNNTISFEDAFNYHHLSSPATALGSRKHIHKYEFAKPKPTLGELRGQIYVLQEFKAGDGPYGLQWEGAEMTLEDYWIIPDIYHLSEKWSAIRDALEFAALAPDDNQRLFLSHLSASVGVLPIEAAAGPMNRSIQGMNDMTGQYLQDAWDKDLSRVGVVIMDFPGRKLIDAVLKWNANLK